MAKPDKTKEAGPLLQQDEKTLTAEELEAFQKTLDTSDPESLRPFFEIWSMLNRSLEGKPIDPEEVFQGYLNVKDIRERTRFPSLLDLKRHVFLRTFEKYTPEAKPFKDWADEEAYNFISYPKGEGRKEGIEIMKAKGMIMQGVAPVFMGDLPRQEEKKGRIQRLRDRISGPSEESGT